MKNSNLKYVFIILFIIIIIGVAIYFFIQNNKDSSNTNVNTQVSNSENNASRTSTNIENTEVSTPPKETQISTYSTVIKDNSAGRLANIRITCDIINGTIINPTDTFSFNAIVGKPTSERGYQEAKIIVDHKTETGIGGGNCQVSSTLYNAVLNIPTLVITERHEHGKDVTYVPDGKDAAVSYGSLDLKFRNDNDYKVKINIITDDKNITATLTKIEE